MKNIVLSILLMSACAMIYAQADSSPYQAIVAVDGSGDYKTVQEAINAVPDGQTKPWLILIKNGLYNEQVIIPKNKPYVHLIGQDKDKTIIHLNLNVGSKLTGKEIGGKTAYWEHSVHNPSSPVYKYEGSVVVVKGDHFYTENIFYGGGDVLLENCTLYNVRSGAVIVAPSHKDAKYGYAFRNCTIDGNSEAADGRLKLGRPWHNNSKTVYINTIMLIPVADEGWTNMGTVPGIFAEYNSRDAQGNVLDLSKRKTEYQYKDRQTGKEVSGTCQATITKEEADKYTYENMIPGNDGWNPRIMMEKLGSPRSLVYQQGTLKWNPVKNAIGYIVYDGEQILGTTTDTSFPVSEVNYALKVSAVNQYGTQGKKGVL